MPKVFWSGARLIFQEDIPKMHRVLAFVIALFPLAVLAIEAVEQAPLPPDSGPELSPSTNESAQKNWQAPSGLKWLTILEVLVDKNGNPADIRVIKSSGNERMDRFAVEQNERREFEVRLENGEPVDYRTEVRVAIPVRAESPGQPIDPLPDK